MADLCQTTDVILALAAGGRPATAAQQAALQAAVDAASGLASLICGGRDFARQTYDEQYEPLPDGSIYLNQMPVNFVIRASSARSAALTIACNLSGVARAWVAMTQGTLATDPPPGITLSSIASGATTARPIPFSGLADLDALAAAVNGISGWTASLSPWASGLPCSDLVGDLVAMPALAGSPAGGAALSAYAVDVPGRLDPKEGVLRTAPRSVSTDGPASDPDWWPSAGGISGDQVRRDRVRVVYDAGYDVVPPVVVQAVVAIAIALLDKWAASGSLESVALGNTSVKGFDPAMLAAAPKSAIDALSKCRIMRA